MPELHSVAVMLGCDADLVRRVDAIFAPIGWRIVAADDAAAGFARVAPAVPAIVMIDARGAEAGRTVAALRQMPAPCNGTPLLLLGNAELATGGPGGHLDLPLDEAALRDLSRHWAGPLGDHTLRREPWGPRYRLLRLMGLAMADAMLTRLAAALEEAVAATDAGGPAPAHRLAGVAGMSGFAELGELWSRVDRGEREALPEALAASRETAEEIARTLAG